MHFLMWLVLAAPASFLSAADFSQAGLAPAPESASHFLMWLVRAAPASFLSAADFSQAGLLAGAAAAASAMHFFSKLALAAPASPLVTGTPTPALLRDQQWMLGPSAGSVDGEIATLIGSLAIPETAQRIFQSDAAALEEVQRMSGVTLAVGFAVAKDLSAGRLVHVRGSRLQLSGEWCASTLPGSARQPAVTELLNFITTPRCTQAMIRGTGVGVTRFRPKVHVTLWS